MADHLTDKNCPVCGAWMMTDDVTAVYCDNPACPVEDNPDLWYRNKEGEWRVQHWIMGPWQDLPTGGQTCSMTLSKKET